VGIRLDYDAVAPGHVKAFSEYGRYLVTLAEDGNHQVLVICERTNPMPWNCAEYTRRIKPGSANWKRAVRQATAAAP